MTMLFTLLSILPYLCLVCTIWVFTPEPSGKRCALFTSIVNGSLVWSLFIWLTSNIASIFNAICQPFIIAIWLAYAAILVCIISRRKHLPPHPDIPGGFLSASIAAICVCSLVAAIAYPPNMWDVHSYHLPRVMHWLQNHTLAPFPTNIPRQTGMPPFNALVAMQSLGMGGGDHFVNLGQWLAFIGMIAAVAQITSQLGGGRKAQILAALFIATLPNAFIHASNTESSNIVSFWTLAAVSIFLDWQKNLDGKLLTKFGLCIGLAVLSKGSAYVVALPFVIMVAFNCLKKPRKLLRQGFCAALIILSINAPHYCRSIEAYGSPFGGAEKNILYHPTPATFVVNGAYNFLLHVPWLLISPLRETWQSGAKILGAEENDKEIFPWGGLDQAVSKLDFGDSSTPNFLQAVVLLGMLVAIVLRKFRPPFSYACEVAASFAMFCLLLSWHPWAARIHTVLFSLAAPLAGIYMESWKSRALQNCLILFFLLWTFMAFQGGLRRVGVFDNNQKNFLYSPRADLYFNAYKRVARPYIDMVNFLAAQNPQSIGLELYDDAFEYPFWALLSEKVKKMPKIFHLLSENDREKLNPQFIVVMGKGEGDAPLALPCVLGKRGNSYIKIFPPDRDRE